MAFVADHEPPNMVGGSVRTVGRFPGISPDDLPDNLPTARAEARSAPAMFAPPICRKSQRNGGAQGDESTRSFSCLRRRRRLPGEHRSERSEPLD